VVTDVAAGFAPQSGRVLIGTQSNSPPRRRDRPPQRHEERQAGLGADLARDVALADEILRDSHVPEAEAAHRAVADLDVHRAREREQRGPPRRVVPRIRALGIEPADCDAAARQQLPVSD
jgi:hypothetical protein